MDYPIIDLSSDETIWLRVFTEDEARELRAKHQQPTFIYWVKDRNGNLLRGINRDGLDRLLGTLRWLDDQHLMKVADDIASLAVLASAQTSFELRKLDGRLAYELNTVYEQKPYRRTFFYKNVLVGHLRSLQPAPSANEAPAATAVRSHDRTK